MRINTFPHLRSKYTYLYSVLELSLYLHAFLLNLLNSRRTAVMYISKTKQIRRTTKIKLGIIDSFFFFFSLGDIYKEEIWVNEEGL